MRTTRRLAALVSTLGLAGTALLAVPAAVPAAGPDPGPPARATASAWTKVTTGNVANIAEPGLHRTGNGVLHLVYPRSRPAADDLAFTTIKANGRVGPTGVAVGGWATLPEDPKVVGTPGGGMRLVFGGIRSTGGGDPYASGQMFSATSGPAGTTWTLEPGALTQSASAYASYGTGAATLADGTPVVSFPLNATVTWNAPEADSTFDFGDCCVYDTTLARDGDQVWIAFAGNGSSAAKAGIFVKRLQPGGPTRKAPRSSDGADTLTPSQSVAFVARPGGGLYTAYCVGYPTCDRLVIWRPGGDGPVTVPGSRGAREVALAASPGGRLWVAWITYDQVRVVTTRPTGLRFGDVRTIRPPRAAPDLYGVSLDATNQYADVVINNGSALYHRRVDR